MDNRSKAAELIRTAKHLVALTGAGISKESNVPTFRGKDGLWKRYNVMNLATPQAFNRNLALVWEWINSTNQRIRRHGPDELSVVAINSLMNCQPLLRIFCFGNRCINRQDS